MSWWRRLKGSPIFGIVLIVVIIVSIYFAFKRTQKEEVKIEKRTSIVICEECGYIFQITYSTTEKPPFKCENCEKNAAYIALECMNCWKIFPMTEPLLADNVCPRCGLKSARPLPYLPE